MEFVSWNDDIPNIWKKTFISRGKVRNCDCIVPSSGGSTKPLKERPNSAEIEVKLIGKCGSPAKLPKTEPASTILQWLDACDPLPTIAAKLQQRHLRTKPKEQPDWENSKGQQPQEGTGSALSLVIAMGIHVGGIKPNSIFDGCDLDLEGSPL